MDAWEAYQNRMAVRGITRRDAHFEREVQSIAQHLRDNLSYTSAVIYAPEHGWNIASEEVSQYAVTQQVAIINSDNLNEKMIMAMPGDEIENGSLVFWMEQYWLVTEQDANNTIYRRSKMVQCNHLLRWVNKDNERCEQWCIVEDGTKLRHTDMVWNSLAYWKRYVKTIPLIAGNPLELYSPQRSHETWINVMV